MEYNLSMTFITEYCLKSTLTISGVKADITKDEANTLMDTIIAKNIFTTKSGAFVKKESAKLTQREVTEFEIA